MAQIVSSKTNNQEINHEIFVKIQMESELNIIPGFVIRNYKFFVNRIRHLL